MFETGATYCGRIGKKGYRGYVTVDNSLIVNSILAKDSSTEDKR